MMNWKPVFAACLLVVSCRSPKAGMADVVVSCTLPYDAVVHTTLFVGQWGDQGWTTLCDMNMGQVAINGRTFSCAFSVPRGKRVLMNQQTHFKIAQRPMTKDVPIEFKNGSAGTLPSGASDQWTAYEAAGIEARWTGSLHGTYNDGETYRCNLRRECFKIFGACSLAIDGNSKDLTVSRSVVAGDRDRGAVFSFFVL